MLLGLPVFGVRVETNLGKVCSIALPIVSSYPGLLTLRQTNNGLSLNPEMKPRSRLILIALSVTLIFVWVVYLIIAPPTSVDSEPIARGERSPTLRE